MGGKPQHLPTRFWSKVRKADEDGCWEWTAHRQNKGYGLFAMSSRRKAPMLAHRVSYELELGPIPHGQSVLHRCDNPACVRPSHLFLGTIADNNADMRAKGRQGHGAPRGQNAHNALFTNEQVLLMRKTYSPIEYAKAALAFGTSPQNAHRILNRKSWRHI